jgi:hypothetical protein
MEEYAERYSKLNASVVREPTEWISTEIAKRHALNKFEGLSTKLLTYWALLEAERLPKDSLKAVEAIRTRVEKLDLKWDNEEFSRGLFSTDIGFNIFYMPAPPSIGAHQNFVLAYRLVAFLYMQTYGRPKEIEKARKELGYG